jgi:DNA repair exonuclease SbcCD ATPase subunit
MRVFGSLTAGSYTPHMFKRFFARKSPLEREIQSIERKILREELRMDRLSAQFWADGGVCCPSCGVPGYSELMFAQERREAWLKILREKLAVRSHI